ncbi:MAG TPA: DUF5399 family protein [Rhabdochlamydiaceae bacterium]|nr:DUF5399 family protein [Rhabdochlamydiaceae bacterium]
MNAVTIDKLDIKVHERYAQDQQKLDTSYIKESASIAPHSEIIGTSSIYSSKWEELFEIQAKNISWANFSPPPGYQFQARRFFSYLIAPSIPLWEEDQEEVESDTEEDKGEMKKSLLDLLTSVKSDKKGGISHLIEKEKTILLNLFDSIKELNTLLKHINSRKIQYQKG